MSGGVLRCQGVLKSVKGAFKVSRRPLRCQQDFQGVKGAVRLSRFIIIDDKLNWHARTATDQRPSKIQKLIQNYLKKRYTHQIQRQTLLCIHTF